MPIEKKTGKLLTSRRYNRPPLLHSCPGGFSRSWPYKTCQGGKGNDNIYCAQQYFGKCCRIFFLLCCFVGQGLGPVAVSAQAIDNTLSYKHIGNDSYFRFIYENDVFTKADKYYTQGINIELVTPKLRYFPLAKLLIHPAYQLFRYAIGIEHNAYTPSEINPSRILYGDRPFAAALFLKTSYTGIDPGHHQRFSTTLSTGVIGQAAFGAEMQTGIHHALNNITPRGWPNQVHNDVILNYEVDYEKQLWAISTHGLLTANGYARLGTLSDRADIGVTAMAGYFESPFGVVSNTKRKSSIYIYGHPEIYAVGYDVTMQGGVFNHTSPYTISASDISRIVFQNRFGVVVIHRNIHLEYFQTFITREFTAGNTHKWGGIQIAFGL